MPIYAYRCSACGHAQDVLQRMSDPVLTVCPSCAANSYTKQVTAAGFQLKGSGWYVTDFRGGNTATKAADGEDAAKPADPPADKAAEKGDAKPAVPAADKSAPPAAAPAAPTPAPAPAAAAPTPTSGG